MKTTQKLIMGLLTTVILWMGCKKDEDPVPTPPPPINEEEVITTLKLTFTDSSDNTNIKYATFRDSDGDGSQAPDTRDTIKLEQNKTWFVSLTLLNELASPADTISNEVQEEAEDHLFCYSPAGNSATVIVTDKDTNNLPLGLQSKWKTTNAGSGTMQVILKHQPGIKDGTCAPGETDIDITFQTKIQ